MTEAEAVVALDGWQGAAVAVRITTDSDQLVAVFCGWLQKQSQAKAPALFWPIEQATSPPAEDPGIYLHPESVEDGVIREGGFVIELRHGGVTTNVRRLDAHSG